MRKVRNDLLLAGGILLLALASLLLLRLVRTDGGVAVVTVDGAEVGRYPLDTVQTVDIPGLDGTNRLVIANGEARMVDADCPDRLCVRQGAVRYAGESIVCLPHRVVVTVEGGQAADIDAAAG